MTEEPPKQTHSDPPALMVAEIIDLPDPDGPESPEIVEDSHVHGPAHRIEIIRHAVAAAIFQHTRTTVRRVRKMDPRIRARRIEVRREEGQRRLKMLTIIFGSMIAFIAIYLITISPLFNVDSFVVSGTSNTTVDEILDAGNLSKSTSMVWVNTSNSEEKIEELPWIKKAKVVRDWSNKLNIVVTERVPVLVIPNGPSSALVDKDGRILDVVDGLPEGLPRTRLAGVGGEPGSFVSSREYAQLAGAMSASLRREVESIFKVEDRVVMKLRSGIAVRLGDTSLSAEKMASVEAVLPHVPPGSTYLDVEVPSAPVSGSS